jgi:hypothetical protein
MHASLSIPTRNATFHLELLRNLLGQDLDVPVGSVHADPLPIGDQPGGSYHTDDSRQSVLRAITAP